jgi:hypothetical protein
MASQMSATHSAVPQSKSEIAFIDRGIDDLATLLAGMRPEVEPILLSDDEPAPRQMAQAVHCREGIKAIHVIAHGQPGEVCFASGALSNETLGKHAADLAKVGRTLGDGELRLWTCNTAKGERGSAFVNALARVIGTEVAASTQLVGHSVSGGQWTLEAGASADELHAPLTMEGMAAYVGVMVPKTFNGNGSGTNGNWSTSKNWTPNGAPASGDDVTISNGVTVNYDVTSSPPHLDSLSISNNSGLSVGGHALFVNGTGSGATDALSIASGSTLSISTGGSVTAGSLAISGTLTGGGTVVGAITLSGGTITQTGSALTLDSITGHGTVTGSPTITTVTASGGTLDFQGTIDATTLTSFHVANGGDLKFDGNVGSGANTPSITFDGVSSGTGILDLTGEGRGPSGEIAKFDGTVSNFATGDQILVSGLSGDTVSYSGDTSGGTLTVKNSGGITEETIKLTGDYTHATFSIATGSTDIITTSADCFLEGTRVRTPDGEVAVETLNRGDIVLTSDGAAKPVTWLGKQTISTVFSDPLRVWPIRIKAGALRENVPVRDLLLSPDHAVLVDGALIQAGALVNGTSIVRETTVPRIFVYYHVELDDHSLVLAENTPAETFVDNVDRLRFDNWAEHEALYPDGKSISELPYPRAKAHRQVPVNIRVMLAERAELIGAVVDRSAVA